MVVTSPVIVWFRQDFRQADNAALTAAVKTGAPIFCVHILDEAVKQDAARWWLGRALDLFDADLRQAGGALHVFRGPAIRVLPVLVAATGARAVFWNRRYDPDGREADTRLKALLKEGGTSVHSFPGALLHEPWTIRTRAGQPYHVFGAYWRAACQAGHERPPLPAPARMTFAMPDRSGLPPMVEAGAIGQEMSATGWTDGLADMWQPDEASAQENLAQFLDGALDDYARDRDFAARPATSGLSPFLRWGHITPAQVRQAAAAQPASGGLAKFMAELGWREFAWSVLFAQPDLASRNLRPEFDAMPWRKDPDAVRAWQRGRTGYPLVDAGMRQLWRTGWMHNRVRMVVASFLVKHLLIDWREGERWFAHTLVDYDPASNGMNWQWVAGTGVEAAPFFRMMNPLIQSRKFDPSGAYIREWVPELARLPDAQIHTPWLAGGISGYPAPIVVHEAARERALSAWRALRGTAEGGGDNSG
ncbi:deoxyribodipyrimidine photo-lyase [Gluconacetobacter sp. 1b LMG 1731]|uniref:Deoxyribodipyrimidine photo-lyase n=1 Tax=Gluconacetobacter dulcium TaxID=2729096 RepID=A0A7W4IN11_9PROT|nr:deoxyribodipyrimidine photo-lyase [Gluconacetobacter dulcium]MBB2165935.1 deoxyribodipyrimidine photo-lyase [Gluconacetobacter dulcium]MBB2195063.1 deoxyribodipyrimidine photo-lyase [Gluconacetobacter dulcium]